ncbi:Rha family transcriptional regulator [Staphylococcus sp. LKG3-3]|uniref:Rha family transcriptional regulator n=1 Tax=Staphylococcus sp. LKG3-3 TaxID=3399685 RepID=UPI003D4A2F09
MEHFNLEVFEQDGVVYTDSREVANMVDRRHTDLLRDIDVYISHLGQNANLRSDDFFVESSYKSGTGKHYKQYLITQKGCDMIANKMTGAKGTQFTAAYVNAFYNMKEHIEQQQYQVPQTPMQALELMFNVQKEQEQFNKQMQQELTGIRSIVGLNSTDWRKDSNKIMASIAQKLGGGTYHETLRNEAYKQLENKARCRLDQRLNNRKSNMLAQGMGKTKIRQLTKLDVIAEDTKLIEIYLTVVKDLAIHYGIDIKELNLGGNK